MRQHKKGEPPEADSTEGATFQRFFANANGGGVSAVPRTRCKGSVYFPLMQTIVRKL